MEDKRKLKRFSHKLNVTEQTSGNLIGFTGDIHQDGLMLVTKFQTALFLNIPVWVDVPVVDGTKNKIPLVIEGVWTQKGINSDLYNTGCQLVAPTPEALSEITELIENFKSLHEY